MATEMQAKGSWLLRILIVIGLVILIVSIQYPKRLWSEQKNLVRDCRERMDNLNYITQRYHRVNGYYSADLDSLLSFIRNDSIVVGKPLFEIEKLTLLDAKNDSLLVGFLDRYHYQRIVTERVAEDSIVMRLEPKPIFQEVCPPLEMALAGDKAIRDSLRGKGEDDIYHLVWSRGKIRRQDLPFDTVIVPSRKYLLYRDVEELTTDPITGKEFHLHLNVRLTLEGKVTYKMLKKDRQPEPAVLDDELMTNLLVNRLARAARAKLEVEMKKDTSLYAKQLELQSDFFEVELESQLQPGKTVEISADHEVMVPIDSIEHFRNPEVIKQDLFHTVYDSLIRVWTKWDQVQEKFSSITYTEDYSISKIDTVGVTIAPPFRDKYRIPPDNFLETIYNIGPVKNPGFIENNDLSWEEKR